MRKMLLLSASVAFLALSGPGIADDREDCFSSDVDRIIRGCTEVINGRPGLSQRIILAIVYHSRLWGGQFCLGVMTAAGIGMGARPFSPCMSPPQPGWPAWRTEAGVRRLVHVSAGRRGVLAA
jgi:hypothetical protein